MHQGDESTNRNASRNKYCGPMNGCLTPNIGIVSGKHFGMHVITNHAEGEGRFHLVDNG